MLPVAEMFEFVTGKRRGVKKPKSLATKAFEFTLYGTVRTLLKIKWSHQPFSLAMNTKPCIRSMARDRHLPYGNSFCRTAQENFRSSLDAPGELKPGQQLVSDCGRCNLQQQADGNLVIYENGIPVWATGVSAAVPKGAKVVTMFLEDGNLVQCLAYPNGRHGNLWDAQCGRRGGKALVMRNDGNLVIYREGDGSHDPDNAIWASDSWVGGRNRGRNMTGYLESG